MDWVNSAPYSADFEDIYYSPDASAEVQRVFLDPVNFSARVGGRELLLAETGFGTGLNVTTAAEHALACSGRLHVFSCEAAPLSATDARRALQQQPANPLSDELLASWPPLLRGWHRRVLAQGRVRLSLYHGDVESFLGELEAQLHRGVDHWLLDGFAPDRNPAMWRDELMQRIGALTAAGGTVATFTAKGQVRRALQSAGFEMRRIDQRPHKRESLAGEQRAGRVKRAMPSSVTVVGAGFAGAWTARSLAERDVAVTVIDRAPRLGGGASGLPAAAQHGRLLADGSPAARLRAAGALFASARTAGWSGVRTMGALQGPGPTADAARLERIASRYAASGDWLTMLTAAEATERAGVNQLGPRLWFDDAAIVDGPALLAELLTHPRIQLRLGTAAQLGLGQPTVVATGAAVTAFDALASLEVLGIGGQLDIFQASSIPRCILLGDGYLAPLGEAHVAVGSTYEHKPWPSDEASMANQARLDAFGVPTGSLWQSRFRAERAVSSDRTPVVGAVSMPGFEREPGSLWVCTGMGSLGTTFAPLAGEVIASQLLGEPAPLEVDLLEAIHPERFRARQARRGLRHGAREVNEPAR